MKVPVTRTSPFSGHHDRVLEIAIIRIRPDGTLVDEYCTLLFGARAAPRELAAGVNVARSWK